MRFVLVALLALLLAGGGAYLLLGGGGGTDDDLYVGDDGDLTSGAGGSALLTGMEGGARKPTTAETASDGPQAGSDLTDFGGQAVHGRVVGENRQPLVNAEIEVVIQDREVARGTTDENGEYHIGIGEGSQAGWTWCMVKARFEGPLIGYTGVWFGPGSAEVLEAPPITMAKAQQLEGIVVRGMQPVAKARASVIMSVMGQWRVVGECTCDDKGRFQFDELPEGNFNVLAAAEGHGRSKKQVTLPRTSDDTLQVELVEEQLVEISVEDAKTGEPIVGARIDLADNYRIGGWMEYILAPSFSAPPTDENGRVVLRGLPANQSYRVAATAEGYPLPNPYGGSGRHRIRAGRDAVTIKLNKARTVRFPLGRGEAEAPKDGEKIEVTVAQWMQRFVPNLEARIEKGELVWDDVPHGWIQGQFVAKSGAAAGFSAPQRGDKGPELKFGPVQKVTIELREKGGDPVSGARIRLQGAGMLTDNSPQTTGPDGRAVFEHVQGKKPQAYLLPLGQQWGGVQLGQIDLSKKEEVYVLEIAPQFGLTLEVVIDGAPGLPPAYSLSVGNIAVQPAELREDATAGTITTDLRRKERKGKAKIQFSAQGFLVEEQPTIDLDKDPPYTVKLVLKAAGSLDVRVDAPADNRFNLQLQRFDRDKQKWVNAAFRNRPGNQGRRDDGSQRFDGLQAGTYRVRDTYSNIESEATEVELGVEPAELSIDLRDSVQVSGVIRGPEGAQLHMARIKRIGIDNMGAIWSGVNVNNKGAWSFRSRRGTRIPITVTHPVLTAAAQSMRVDVVAGQDVPTLFLEGGNELHFRVPGNNNNNIPMVNGFNGRWGGGSPQVHLIPREENLTPLNGVGAIAKDGVYRIGVPAPGRYDIHIVSPNGQHAPYTVKNRALGTGVTDLGTIQWPGGSQVIFRVSPQPSPKRPNMWVSVRHIGTPGYNRGGWLQGTKGEEVIIRGLGAGKFRVTVHAQVGGQNRQIYNEEVELDGTNDLEIPIDLPSS